jgi:microcystin-dependent protein
MAAPFLGELRIMPFNNVVPYGWALCNGQVIAIDSNTSLFQLLGTTYGGDGVTTFGLPNLQGRVPIGMGNGFKVGQQVGEYFHMLTAAEMPAHTHTMLGTAQAGNASRPDSNASLAQGLSTGPGTPQVDVYGTGSPSESFSLEAISANGSSLPHDNQQPFLAVNVCIATVGIFPSQD